MIMNTMYISQEAYINDRMLSETTMQKRQSMTYDIIIAIGNENSHTNLIRSFMSKTDGTIASYLPVLKHVVTHQKLQTGEMGFCVGASKHGIGQAHEDKEGMKRLARVEERPGAFRSH